MLEGSVQFLHPTNLEQTLRCLTTCNRFKYFCESLRVFKLNLTIHTFLALKRHCMFLPWAYFTCLLFYVKLLKCLVDPSHMYVGLWSTLFCSAQYDKAHSCHQTQTCFCCVRQYAWSLNIKHKYYGSNTIGQKLCNVPFNYQKRNTCLHFLALGV